ncbi:hypothetical protein J1N35_026465 [Gossypium stocksii]|uniref:Uncharacterized protein n=1 Tax=Gossypium stocksii TaxID=47602 RepID=A0A9D3V8E6_9ROSI|nr:hypothetical protein J1N35_026465 [Gossypium stocksii]
MICKDGDDEDEDDSSILSLLKCLLKDFDGGSTDFDNDDDAKNFGIMIVKSNHRCNTHDQSLYSFKPPAAVVASPMRVKKDRLNVDDDDGEEENEEDEDGNRDGKGYGTFVMRSTGKREGNSDTGLDM